MSTPVAAMGFAPHSGWAAMIVLGSAEQTPRVLARSRIDMIDHRVPESKQPYHAVEGLNVDEAARRLDRYMTVAVDMAYSAIHQHAGDHFRNALAAAAGRSGVSAYRVLARNLDGQAAACIRRPVPELRDAVKSFGRGLGPPWGADQKMAALLAWFLLERGAC